MRARSGFQSMRPALAFEGLLEHMQGLVEFSVLASLAADLADRMEHGGVVPAPK